MTEGARTFAGSLLGIAVGAAFCIVVIQIESAPLRLAGYGAGIALGLGSLAWARWRDERAANPAARLGARHAAKLAGIALLSVLVPISGYMALTVLGLETPEERMFRAALEQRSPGFLGSYFK